MIDLLLLIMPKHIDNYVLDNLNIKEVQCKCSHPTCHYTLISPNVLQAFNRVRKQFKTPLHINSGFRCQSHNIEVGGAPKSRHTRGLAIDISHDEFLESDKKRLLEILKRHFDKVIVYNTFYHCHNLEEIKQT